MVERLDDRDSGAHMGSDGTNSRAGIKFGGLLLRILAVALLVAIGLVVWRVIDVQSQERALRTKLAALSAAGKAIDAAGVKRLHEERTSDELTEQWQALLAELSGPELRMEGARLPIIGNMYGEANQIPPRGEAWKDDAAVHKFLSDTRTLRDRLRKLTLKSQAVYFPMQYEGEGKGDSDAYEAIAFAIRLFRFEGLAALRYDVSAAAIEDVRCLLAILKVLEGEPSMMSMAVCSSAENAAMEIIKSAVERSSLSEEQLTQLLETLQAYQPSSERFSLVVQGERGMLQTALDSFSYQQGPLELVFGAPHFRIAALQWLDRLEAIPMDDVNALLKAGRDVQAEIEEIGFGNRSSADTLAPLAIIPLTARTASIVSREMERRLAVLAIAIRLYQAKFEELPTEISEVAKTGVNPAKLVPIGGKPFGYRLNDGGNSGTLWGFSLLSGTKQTPDEPPDIDDSMGLNQPWIWRLEGLLVR